MKETTRAALMEGRNIHIDRMDNRLRKTIDRLSETLKIIECAVDPGMAARLNVEPFSEVLISRDIDIIVIHQAELLTLDHYIFMCNAIVELGGYFPQVVLVGDLNGSPYELDEEIYGAFDFAEDTCTPRIWSIFETEVDSAKDVVVYKQREWAKNYNEFMLNNLKGEERVYKAELKGKVTECPLAPVEMRLKVGEQVIMLNKRPHCYKPGNRGVITALNDSSIMVNVNGKQCIIEPRTFGTVHNVIFHGRHHIEVVQTVKGFYEQFPVAPGYAIALTDLYGMQLEQAAILGLEKMEFVQAVKNKADLVRLIVE